VDQTRDIDYIADQNDSQHTDALGDVCERRSGRVTAVASEASGQG
jgi:hypothetical protein